MKNKVLKGIAYVVGILWLLSACCVDSESYISLFINFIYSSYLYLFGYANNWFEDMEGYEDEDDEGSEVAF